MYYFQISYIYNKLRKSVNNYYQHIKRTENRLQQVEMAESQQQLPQPEPESEPLPVRPVPAKRTSVPAKRVAMPETAVDPLVIEHNELPIAGNSNESHMEHPPLKRRKHSPSTRKIKSIEGTRIHCHFYF